MFKLYHDSEKGRLNIIPASQEQEYNIVGTPLGGNGDLVLAFTSKKACAFADIPWGSVLGIGGYRYQFVRNRGKSENPLCLRDIRSGEMYLLADKRGLSAKVIKLNDSLVGAVAHGLMDLVRRNFLD